MYRLMIFFQLFLFIYHQITTLVDLYPFNDVKHQPLSYKLLESIPKGILMVLPPIGFIFNIKPLMHYAVIFYPILLVGMFFLGGYIISINHRTGGSRCMPNVIRVPLKFCHQLKIILFQI